MKKIALLLSVIMLLTCLGACADNGETSDTSDETSGTPAYSTQLIDALYKTGVDRENYIRTNAAIGCSYTLSRDASDTIPDDGVKITDGNLCADDKDESEYMKYVGFVGRKEISITVDLGAVETGLSDFSLTALSSSTRAAVLPRSVVFSVSSDGTNFADIGTVYRPESALGDVNYEFCLRLNGGIEARYVRATVPEKSIITLWIFLDELGVYKYDIEKDEGAPASNTYYKNPTFPAVTEPEYWDSSDSDYNDTINLLSGTKYSISPILVIPDALLTDYYNTQPSGGQLTDGKTGSSSYSDAAYMHFTNGSARVIVFDLTKTSSAQSFMISFFVETDYAINLPATVTVYASTDGEGWQKLSQQALSGLTDGRHEFTAQFDNATKARFIKVIFDTAAHVWCDEIRVYGTKNVSDALDVVPNEEKTLYPNEYLSLDALGGSENILLAYNFKVEYPSVGLTTKDEYLPYVAYYDTEGNMKDTFFDSYLYLACSTVCPSGGVLYYNSDNPAIMSDWIAYEEDTFAEGYNVNALNEAVGEVCDTLDLDDYKAYVYLPIFSTVYGDKNFGDVDGDGVNEDFTNIEDRKKAIKWWIDRLMKRYESGEYENLTLNGFYWNHEAIVTGDPHELELLSFTADYLHSLGLYFFWIPYYCASGYTDWASYGFDAANMQPNYMFTESATEQRVYDNAELTKLLGMGVEIEIDGKAISTTEYLERYRSYLRVGVEEGYMNSIKMYYQDAGPGVFYQAWKSENAAYRSIYDDTYLYAKRLLAPMETTLKTDTFSCESGSSVSIKLEDGSSNVLVSTVYVSCRYGTLKAETDGTITYTAPEGFVGTETFIAKGGTTLFTNEYEITLNVG